MIHNVRWTTKNIAKRIELFDSLVYRKRVPLGDFRYRVLDDHLNPSPAGNDVDVRGWETISANSLWGARYTELAMRNEFSVKSDWDTSLPVALYLPVGESGDFSHPDGVALGPATVADQLERVPAHADGAGRDGHSTGDVLRRDICH